ncbi:cytochrome b/b6 domain-containing protein [Pseudoroseicyclus sp. H15]
MTRRKIWDPLVRIFHWSLVTLFALNAFVTNPEHEAHHLIGYAVGGLILVRVIWGLIGPIHARFSDFPPSARGAWGQVEEMATGRRHAHAGHSPLGALMIYNLLLTFIVIVASGYAMTTLTFFGIRWVKEVHEIAVTWAEISALAHIAAVLFESVRLRLNLPLSMVTGYKSLPEGAGPGE